MLLVHNALVIGKPHHPHPGEAWGICGGNRGWTSLCAPWGGGLGQLSLMSNTNEILMTDILMTDINLRLIILYKLNTKY